MNHLPSLIINGAMKGYPMPERENIKKPKQNSTAPNFELDVGFKQNRESVEKKKLVVEKHNNEIKNDGFSQTQITEERKEVLVKQKRKYAKKSKVPIAAKAKQTPNNKELSPPSQDYGIGGLALEEVGKRDLNDGKRKRAKKFEHVFIHGLNTTAIDGLEFHELIRKIIRAKAQKESPKGWAEVCSNYKIIINAELRAVKAELEVIKSFINRGYGHMRMERRIPIGLANIIVLALEALEVVSKTWKNAHAIFVSAKKSLQDMDCFVGYMEFRRQDPDYWWSKAGGFALEDIPSGRHRPQGKIMTENGKGNPEMNGIKRGDEGYFTEGTEMEVSDENVPGAEDGEHSKKEEQFEDEVEEYLGQEYRELVGGRLDFSSRKADWKE